MKKIVYCTLAVLMACSTTLFTACDDDEADALVISTSLPETNAVGEYTGTWTFTNTETGEVSKTIDGSLSIALNQDSVGNNVARTAMATVHCPGESFDGKSGVCNVTATNGVVILSNSTSKNIGTNGHYGEYTENAKGMYFRFAQSVKQGRKYVATRIEFSGNKQ